MITLAVGLMYLWGIIITYATSYFRIISRNASLTENQTNLLFPLTLLGQVRISQLRLFLCFLRLSMQKKCPLD